MSWLISQAMMDAYGNLPSLQERVEEYLGDISLDGERSVPLSGNNTQQAYCAPDKMTKFSRLSRFGMTYKPLTESLGEELLTLYLADFHAKTSQLRGGGRNRRRAIRNVERNVTDYWRGSTKIRICGEQSNARY